MSGLLTVHDPRGYPPKVTGKRLAPRLRAWTARSSIWSIVCSTIPKCSWSRCSTGSPQHLPAVDHPHHQAARELGGRSRTCARRSSPTATPRSSVSGFEAPVARRSSGWRWRWRRAAFRASRSTPMCSRGSHARRRSPTACRARGRRSCRSRSSTAPPRSCAPISKAPIRSRAARSCRRCIEGLTGALDRRGSEGRLVRSLNLPRLLDAGHRGQSAAAVHREPLDRLPRRSCCRPRSVSRRCSRAPAIRPTRWWDGCGRRASASSGSSRSRRWR